MKKKYRIVKTGSGMFMAQLLTATSFTTASTNQYVPPPVKWVNVSPCLDTIEIAEAFVKQLMDNDTIEVVKVYE